MSDLMGRLISDMVERVIFPPTFPYFHETSGTGRRLDWEFRNLGSVVKKPMCAYFSNTERGIECTARNCPCELYEAE